MRQPAQILGPTRGARLSALVFALLFALGALIPAPVARASAPADVEFHHHDAFGNLIAITDAQGQRIWRGTPEPYGAGAARFQGRPRESSDVFLLGARAYDPLAGKFLSPDPQSLTQVDLTRPEQFNRYAYALNNPYRYQDPNGEVPVETLLDIADVASSAYDLYNEPSWMNAGFLAWSVASVALPYVPGAWTAKGLKKGGKILDAFDGAKDASHAVEAGSDAAATCARGGCTSHGLCFAAGTLVVTEDGLRPIEEIELGDLVWASQPDAPPELRRVENTFVRLADTLIRLELEDASGLRSTLEATPEHPFYVIDLDAFVPARDLEPGDRLRAFDGNPVRVASTSAEHGAFVVYNFEVATEHTYYVASPDHGETSVLVHNNCDGMGTTEAGGQARFVVTESGVAIPTTPAELRSNLSQLTEASTKPAESRKFVGSDSQGPLRVRVERAHPDDPNFQGTPDPLHTVDHLHIDRRANGQTGSWGSTEKVPYDWPF